MAEADSSKNELSKLQTEQNAAFRANSVSAEQGARLGLGFSTNKDTVFCGICLEKFTKSNPFYSGAHMARHHCLLLERNLTVASNRLGLEPPPREIVSLEQAKIAANRKNVEVERDGMLPGSMEVWSRTGLRRECSSSTGPIARGRETSWLRCSPSSRCSRPRARKGSAPFRAQGSSWTSFGRHSAPAK